eukprot:TRINITY_DN1816_c0_g1_i1.p1 TRINITY_DN1816_c0_g1~~TRINITY_DN1816_c0_g1_i1.p1  ORF type:complete len:242 (+),score=51.94 TRINITY_DN1816_c0_g1_i1:38-763(+)
MNKHIALILVLAVLQTIAIECDVGDEFFGSINTQDCGDETDHCVTAYSTFWEDSEYSCGTGDMSDNQECGTVNDNSEHVSCCTEGPRCDVEVQTECKTLSSNGECGKEGLEYITIAGSDDFGCSSLNSLSEDFFKLAAGISGCSISDSCVSVYQKFSCAAACRSCDSEPLIDDDDMEMCQSTCDELEKHCKEFIECVTEDSDDDDFFSRCVPDDTPGCLDGSMMSVSVVVMLLGSFITLFF